MKQSCKSVPAQPALFTAVRWPKASNPKRTEVLTLANSLLPWQHLEEVVRPFYRADVQHTGRKGYALGMMLRCFALQYLWRVSDRQLEAAILDSHAMCEFIGSDPWAPRPPSASAIRAFRTLLEQSFHPQKGPLDAALRLELDEALRTAGVECRPGEIRDPVFRRVTVEAVEAER